MNNKQLEELKRRVKEMREAMPKQKTWQEMLLETKSK
jgi:hypothetical protein